MDNITCVLPRICDFNGNLKENWYIEYWFLNPKSQKKERFKKYKGINTHPTIEGRKKAAQKLCAEWTLKLQSGYNPFEREDVIYHNHLAYDKDINLSTKTKDFSIEYYLNKVMENKKRMLEKNNLRLKTYQAYLTKCRALVKYLKDDHLHNINIKLFDVTNAKAFGDHLWTIVHHNKTWNTYIETMRMMWREIAKQYPLLLLANPWDKVDLLKYESTPATAFTSNQIVKLKEHLIKTDPYLLMICEVVYYCFIRPCSELPLLQVKDLNFEYRCIIVPGMVSKNKKTQPVKIPKPLMDKFIEMKIGLYPENYFLFTRFGEPKPERSGRDHFSKRFKKVLDKLGFGKGYSIYSWKHTGNRKLAESDIPMKFAQLQNRHHSLDQVATYQQSLTLLNTERLYEQFPEM